MSFMKPTKSSLMRHDEQKKVVKQGVAKQQVPGRVKIDRVKLTTDRPTVESIDQVNYLDTETTPELRRSEVFQTRNSLIAQQQSGGNLQKTQNDNTVDGQQTASSTKKNVVPSKMPSQTPRVASSTAKKANADSQRALSSRLSQPKVMNRRASQASEASLGSNNDQLNLSNKKQIRPLYSARNSVIHAQTKSQIMRQQATSNEKMDKKGRNSVCLNSSLNSSLKSRQLQTSLRLSQNPKKIEDKSGKDALPPVVVDRQVTKSALEIQLDKIKLKTNKEYFKNSQNRPNTSMMDRKTPDSKASSRLIRNTVPSRLSNNSRSNSKLKGKVQELQQTFGRKVSVKENSAADRTFTVNSSLFQTAKDESEHAPGPDGQFQTALLSSIGDLDDHQENMNMQQNDTEPFNDTNIFKSNFEVQDEVNEEVDFIIDGSTILNQDQQQEMGPQSNHDDSFNFEGDSNLTPPKNNESKGEFTVGKIRRNKHDRKFTMEDIGQNPAGDSIIHVNVVDVSHDSNDDIQAENLFAFNGQNQSTDDFNGSEAQITAVLGNSTVQQDSSLNDGDSHNHKLDFNIRKSSILHIQIDEVDSENENDNSYFNDHGAQMPNSKKSVHSKAFNYEEQMGEAASMTTKKNNNNNDMDSEFELVKAQNKLNMNEVSSNEDQSDSINTVAVIEESSDNEEKSHSQNDKEAKSAHQSKDQSPKKRETAEFDIITADFEVQSQNNRQDRLGLMTGSFAQIANQSILENQELSINNNNKQINDELSPGHIRSTREHRNSSVKRPAQRIDFSFQLDGSPERSMKILNTLSSAKQNGEGSTKKNERSITKPFNSELFVVHEATEGDPTPKNKKKMEFKFYNNSMSDKSNSLLEQMKKISPIKQIMEEDSEDRSRNTPNRLSSYNSKNSIEKKKDDNDKFLKLIKNQNQQEKQDTEVKQVSQLLDLEDPNENGKTQEKQKDLIIVQPQINENQRLTLQEKIQQRKKKLQQEEQMKQNIFQPEPEQQEEDYQSPQFKPRSSIRQPKFFKFEGQDDDEQIFELCPQEQEIKSGKKNDRKSLRQRDSSLSNEKAFPRSNIRLSKTKTQKFSMESIKMNFIMNQNQTKNVSMRLDEQQQLDQSNPFDESNNDLIKTAYASAHDSKGTHQIHNLAKFVDDQLSNNQTDRNWNTLATNNSARKSQKHKRQLAIAVEEDQLNGMVQNKNNNEPSLRLSKIGTAMTPKPSNTFNETPRSNNYTARAGTITKKMQDFTDKVTSNSPHVNRVGLGPAPGTQNEKTSHNDDVKSNYSRISKVSRFTNNLMNKSNNMINDQWYQFIYNYDDQCLDDDDEDDTVSMTRSQGGISRFTLNSKLSNAGQSNLSKISKLQSKCLQQKAKGKAAAAINQPKEKEKCKEQGHQVDGAQKAAAASDRSPIDKLNDLLASIDICRLIRLNWLLGPMINRRTVKSRIFNFLCYQVCVYVNKLDCPIKKAICHYLVDDLIDCIEVCKVCRQQYLQQYKVNRKQTQYDSYQMVKVWVIELTCHIELMREDQTTQEQRDALRMKAHEILKEMPQIVKRRQYQHFTIIELILQYQEKIAYSKLKDLDFISYKLFKLERAISLQIETVNKGKAQPDEISQLFIKEDEDEKKSPEEYCAEIQKQFNRIPTSEQIKKIEYYMYGALCAYRNHHFKEAWNFVSQAPFICNFGEQVPDVETLVVFEMLKMVEIKLLTKIGRPEQAIIQLSNRFFQNKIIDDEQFNKLFPFSASQQNQLSFDTHIFLDQTWYLYKKIQYTCQLIEFKQEQLKFKMVSCIGQDFNQDANALQKANDDLYNQMYHLLHIMKSLHYYEEKLKFRNRIVKFHWLLLKIILRLEKSGKFQQMISSENFVGLFQRIDIIQVINNLQMSWQPGVSGGLPEGQIAQASKNKNKKLIEQFRSKYGNQPIIKTIQNLQNRLNQKFNKSGQSNIYNSKRATYKNKPSRRQRKFDESRIDLSITQTNFNFGNENDIFGKSILDQSSTNEALHYSQPSIHMESESDMMNKIAKSQSQFFIQLQYITDFVDKKLADINYQAQKDFMNTLEECEFEFEQMSPHKQAFKIKNYFESLKTDKHQKQTKFISNALSTFLSSAKMIVFQNLHTVQEIVDYEIQIASNIVDGQDRALKDQNAKGKNLKSKFLEKSKNVLRAFETIYINEKFLDLNMDNNQTLNDLQKTPYISDEKSCITGLNGLSIIHNKGILNTSHDSQTIDYSYIDNITNLNFAGKFHDQDNVSAQNYASTGLNFNNLKNQKRADLTENYSQYSDSGDYHSACRFEGGEVEQESQEKLNQQYATNRRFGRMDGNGGGKNTSRAKPQLQVDTNVNKSKSRERRKQKSLIRKMKVQYFNEKQLLNDIDDNSHVQYQTEYKNGNMQDMSNLNLSGIPTQRDQSCLLQATKQKNLNNMAFNALTPVARNTHQNARKEEDDFIIQLNQSINEEKQRESSHSSKNQNNSRSSTGGKTAKNSKNHQFLSGKHRKNHSSTNSFLKESNQKLSDHEALYVQSPQMTALIDNLQFGGAHATNNDADANSNIATNQNGRLTFPLNLMQSARKENNQNYFDLERINNNGANNGGNCHEIEQFFDQTSRIAPSQINFNDLEMDMNDNNYQSRSSSLHSSDEDEDEDEQYLSIDDLIHNQQEKLNYTILNHSVYDDNMLYKLAMACCLADNHLNLGIRIINILLKIRNQQELLKMNKSVFMDYLEIMTAYIYLRLNQKQFQKQQSNINNSRILEQNQNTSRVLELNQNTSNRLCTDLSALRIQDLSRDDISQINFQNNSSALFANAGVNNLMDTMTNSLNYGQNLNGVTTTDISQGQVSQHIIAPNHAALKQQIMCIIQNQDYFVQQARIHWKKFDADNFLVNFQIASGSTSMIERRGGHNDTPNTSKMDESTFDPEKSRDVDPHNRLVTVNIITMMLLYVQSELLTYKQIRSYDNMYEVSDIKKNKFSDGAIGYQICLRKLTQEVKNQRMFSAYKKFENRENILKKSEQKVAEKPTVTPFNEKMAPTGLDSVTKVTYSSVLKFGQDEQQKKQQNGPINKDFNLFKKGLDAALNQESPQSGRKLQAQGFSSMRGTADFGLKNLLLTQQESSKKDKRMTLDVIDGEYSDDEIALRIHKK